jgi:hypothetical protein
MAAGRKVVDGMVSVTTAVAIPVEDARAVAGMVEVGLAAVEAMGQVAMAEEKQVEVATEAVATVAAVVALAVVARKATSYQRIAHLSPSERLQPRS